MSGVVLRPAGFEDADFLCRVVAAAGDRIPRVGDVPSADPYAVLDAVWHQAAAVFIGELDGNAVAACCIVELDLLHRTAWVDLLALPTAEPAHLDATLVLTLHHAVRAWNLRTVRSADPVADTPCFAGFGQLAVYEGEIPGRCPGSDPSTAAVRALWFDAAGPGIPVSTVTDLAARSGVATTLPEVAHVD